jgi:hypothetical protein
MARRPAAALRRMNSVDGRFGKYRNHPERDRRELD